MKSMTSYQEPNALKEGLAYGYMMKLRMLRSAAFDIKSFVTDSVLVQIRNNDPSAVLDPIKTVVIVDTLLITTEDLSHFTGLPMLAGGQSNGH